MEMTLQIDFHARHWRLNNEKQKFDNNPDTSDPDAGAGVLQKYAY